GHLLRRTRARRVAAVAGLEDRVRVGADQGDLVGAMRVVARGAVRAGADEALVPLDDLRRLDVVALRAELGGRQEELILLTRGVRIVAGRAVALGEGAVHGLGRRERLHAGVAREAELRGL